MGIERKRTLTCLLLFLVLAASILILFYFTQKAEAAWKWDTVKDFKTYNFRGLACNDKGLYVAVGDDGIIKTSTDLSNWVIRESGTNEYLWGCAWGNEKFVAVGSNGTISYSKDGIHWFNISSLDKNVDFEDVTWGDGKFVAVGCTYGLKGFNDPRYIFSSADGVYWEKTLEYVGSFAWVNIKYINNTFIVYGSKDYAISFDGSNWEYIDLGEIGAMNDIIWDGQQYVRIATEYRTSMNTSDLIFNKISSVYTSDNAMDWKPIKTNLREDLYFGQITQFKDKYYIVASADGANLIFSSDNLSQWILASDTAYSEITSISTSNDKLVFAGWHETVVSSSNGRQWDFDEKYSPHLQKILWDGSKFLVIGNNGTTFLSPDGLHWTQYSTCIKPTLVDAVWTGTEYLALSVKFDPSSYDIIQAEIYKSADGINWSHLSTINEKNLEELYYFNGTAFIIGRNGQIMVSNNGINWTKANSAADKWLRGMSWNGSQYVCVGMFGALLTSQDGINWINRAPITNADLNCVIWNGVQFATVGSWNRIASSEDGVSWYLKFESKDYNYIDALWDGSRFVFLHNMGEVVVSKDARQFDQVSSESLSGPNSMAWNGERYVMVGNSGTICTYIPQDIIKVKINEVPVVFDVAPQIINNRTMIPARAVLEKLGSVLTWDGKKKTIHVRKSDTEILLTIGNTAAYVNGQKVGLDSPAVIIGNRTLVPLRFLAENLGAKVRWDGNTKTVIIN